MQTTDKSLKNIALVNRTVGINYKKYPLNILVYNNC